MRRVPLLSNPTMIRTLGLYCLACLGVAFCAGAVFNRRNYFSASPPLEIVAIESEGLQKAWKSETVRFAVRNQSRRPITLESIGEH